MLCCRRAGVLHNLATGKLSSGEGELNLGFPRHYVRFARSATDSRVVQGILERVLVSRFLDSGPWLTFMEL